MRLHTQDINFIRYECTLAESAPVDFPGLGLPAYLLKPIREELAGRAPGYEIVHASVQNHRVIITLQKPVPEPDGHRAPGRHTAAFTGHDPRTLPHKVERTEKTVLWIRAGNGYVYIVPRT